MNRTKYLVINVLTALSLIMLFAVSCDPDPVTPSNTDENEENSIPPNGNGLITSETQLESSQNKISIMKLILKDDNNFYFFAKKEGSYAIGEISFSGSIVWEKMLDFEVRGIFKINKPFSTLNNNLLVVGVSGTTGKMAHYNHEGNFISDITVDEYPLVMLNDLIQSGFELSDLFRTFDDYSIDYTGFLTDLSLFYVLGAAGTQDNIKPYALYFTINQDGQFEITNDLPNNAGIQQTSVLFTSYPDAAFNKIANNNPFDEAGCSTPDCSIKPIYSGEECTDAILRFNSTDCPKDFRSYATLYTNLDGTDKKRYSACSVVENVSLSYKLENCKLTNISLTFLPLSIGWVKTIYENTSHNNNELFSGRGDIIISDCENIFVVGAKEIEKVNPTNPIKYWDAAFAAKLKSNGTIDWIRTFTGSTFADRFESCFSDGTSLYACGYFGHYSNSLNDNVFGYGQISKIGINTGNLISTKYIGNNLYRSGINTINGSGGRIMMGGATENEKLSNDDPYKGWFVEIDKSSF